ncbi:hypothetical protein KKB99_05775 [bacterium]|nr:hypothetical protein [bacterium]MBU1025499.1 hypothetical protein [bacterium]
MYYEITSNKQIFSPKGTFAFTEHNLEEVLEFLEDMILMTGCPACNSLNTRLLILNTSRSLLCLDCGNNEPLPPPS